MSNNHLRFAFYMINKDGIISFKWECLIMKIFTYNLISYGSTGSIAQNTVNESKKQGYENVFFCGRGQKRSADGVINRNKILLKLNIILSRLTGKQGSFHMIATKKLIRAIKKYKPDIIQLHNLHGDHVNINMLFKFIKKENIPTVITLHDCWAFTGHCVHFDVIGCEKWKTACRKCPQYKAYPHSWFFDTSKSTFKKKAKLFNSVNNLTIVSPSHWLDDFVAQSNLKSKQHLVINNGISLEKFYPEVSDFKTQHNIEGKKVILGVSSPWTSSKGLNVFNDLADLLDDSYQIVVVGANKEYFNPKIIKFGRVEADKMRELYSNSDVFLNPTMSDNYPTVNLEAQACGLPVIAFNTGGCKEQVDKEFGMILNERNTRGAFEAINEFFTRKSAAKAEISNTMLSHTITKMTNEYIKLYKQILNKK